MQALSASLRGLEHLKSLVDELAPIRYESSDRARELSSRVPEAYGAVEDVYRRFAGDQQVVVEDGRHKKTFRNFFEAGWLSSRTFHAGEGQRELTKVIGKVRAALEDESPKPEEGTSVTNAFKLLHAKVQAVANTRFNNGHYADAVEATFKELASTVRALVLQRGGPELDGVPLMQMAFSPKNPIIVLADLATQTGRDMQRGYMDLFAGAMAAIRNPKAHGNIELSPERALHLLFVASTLWHTLDERP
jgi:uncharacterized protein (TIGR02391 family)